MLGRDVVSYLSAKGYEVFPSSTDYLDLLATEETITGKLEAVEPEVVIHCAAYTNVDGAEREPDLAMAINKDGTYKLAMAARELGAIFIYVSTDFVFDGLKGEPYTPADRPNAINAYGLSKHYGELMVSEHLESFYIVRTSWLYGIHNRNFVQFVLESARQGNTVRAARDWIGSPTWTGSLAVAIETLMNSGAFGIYHAADAGEVSRYEQALAICQAAGLSTDHVVPIRGEELNLPANRPQYTVLDCPGLAVPNWETSLQAYLEQYKQLNRV